ncbi:MAG: 30S ribosomal protein S20 [Candidatus Omnitrophica bacterium]|nr:30S ribosomal protein S20 [Candidatus Omnitrophota bacterium]
MPSKKAAIKDLKQSKKRQKHNLVLKKSLKKEQKKIATLIETKDVAKLKTEISGCVSRIDKAVKQKLMHKKKASRQKANIAKKLHQLSLAAKAA